MPMLFISLIVSLFVFSYLVAKKKEVSFSVLMGLMVACVLMLISLVTTFVIPKEYALIEKYEIVPIEIQNQKYFVVSQVNITSSFFFIKDLEGRIKPGKSASVIEEDREDGLLKIYRNESKTNRFLSFIPDRKSEAHIPLNTQLKIQ